MRAEKVLLEPVDRIGNQMITERTARRAPFRHLDPVLLSTAFFLIAFGVVMVYSATAARQSSAGLDPTYFMKRQILFASLGLLVLGLLSVLDYRRLRTAAAFGYLASLVLLAAVLSPLGEEVSGARRWINLGPLQFQPSEITKVVLLVVLAAYLARRDGQIRKRDIGVVLGLVGLPAALIFLEPDLGTMLVLLCLTGGLLMVAGTKFRHLVALALLAVVAVFGALQLGLVRGYQVERLTAFMAPSPDVRSTGYNLAQSKIAIASGGVTGKGLGAENTQTSLAFVPEQHTDFIFTAVGEQLGFVGSAALLAAFALLIWRALRIAAISPDLFGTLLASGIALLWAIQVFVNVGMTMGMMPITGIPLPFVSFGGSSLIVNLIAVALLLNVHMRRFV
jgi:rod shape determining protein RodA